MEYIKQLNDMYIADTSVVDPRRICNIRHIFSNKNIMYIYKEIIEEVLHKRVSSHRLSNLRELLHYDKVVQHRAVVIDQMSYPMNSKLAYIDDHYEEQQLLLHKIWAYNEICMIKLERFTQYNQNDVKNFINIGNDMIYNDPILQRFRRSYANGKIKSCIVKSEWFWNTLSRVYAPGGNIAKKLIIDYQNEFGVD